MSIVKSLTEVFDGFVIRRIEDVNVAIPGQVVSYDSTRQTASVQPLIQRGYIQEDGSRAVEDLPVVQAVPVIFPGAGAYSITFPVANGDTVMLLVSQASLDKWKSQGGKVDPNEDTMHELSDCVAIPGLRSVPEATDQVDSSAMVIGGPEIKLGSKDAADGVVRLPDLEAVRTAISGAVPLANDGGLQFKNQILSAWTAATASTKVKAE